MAISSANAAAAPKTMFRTTLTSGSSYTVPTGVTYLNVTLQGGGGGGGGSNDAPSAGNDGLPGERISSTFAVTSGATITYAIGAGGTGGSEAGRGGAGGTTTMTGATSATGGNGGASPSGNLTGQVGKAAGYFNGGGGSGRVGTGGAGGSGRIDIEYWV